MTRRLVVAAAVAILVGITGLVVVGAGTPRPVTDLTYVEAQPGDSYWGITRQLGLACTHTELYAANGRAPLDPGTIVFIPAHCQPGTTTTTVPATTTTVASTTTTTVAPTTTSSTTLPTTTSTTTTTVVVPDTEPPAAGFLEDFNGPGAEERIASGVFHRDNVIVAQQSWPADHALNGTGDCTSPDQTHTVHRADLAAYNFHCASINGNAAAGHWMTTVGDTSGYSIVWFSPDADHNDRADVFRADDIDTVSFDVNVTDLRHRAWWEVVLVAEGTPFLTTIDWMAQTANIEPYHRDTIALGKGPFGLDGNIFSGGVGRDPLGHGHICDVDPQACASITIRRPFEIHDNRNGTVTFSFLGDSYTYPGGFPDRFHVYFKQHAYTPTKPDTGCPGGCRSYTWHWDNVSIS